MKIPVITWWKNATEFMKRTVCVAALIALVASGALAKLTYVQLIAGKTTAEAATASRTVSTTLSAQRGNITDSHGIVLAQSVERYTIIGDPKAASTFEPTTCTKATEDNCQSINGKPVGATGPAAVAKLLAPVLGMNTMELGAMLTGSNQYVVIKKDVVPTVKRSIDKLNLSGIITAQLTTERVYPNGTLMGSLLGGVDETGTGVAGIEQMENKLLTGTNGYSRYQRGNDGQQIPGTQTESLAAVDGDNVQLTIDRDVQWYVEQALQQGKEKYKADWAVASVQEVSTGKILALADTESEEAGSSAAKLNPSHAVTETFEPGSVGKLVTLSGLLQEKQQAMNNKFSVPYSIDVNGQTYHDSESHGTENWTLAGILQHSSNVGVIMASSKYSLAQRYSYLTKFGVGQSSGIGLPGESDGILSKDSSWDKRTQNTVLFGQGYATNVLQVSNIAATIANKGVKNQQSIIDNVKDENGKEVSTQQPQSTRVVDASVASDMMNAMESVAEGYKSVAGVSGYRVAAKTGTAEVAGANGALTSIVADWVGVLPADNPKYVVTVVLKNPQGTYGGLTAGPIFANIGEFLMQKYEVPTSSPRTGAIPVTW